MNLSTDQMVGIGLGIFFIVVILIGYRWLINANFGEDDETSNR